MIRSRRRVAIVLNCDSGTLYGKGMVFQRLCGVGKTNNNVALIAYTRKLPTMLNMMLKHSGEMAVRHLAGALTQR